jgi:type III pantothenate kinase
MIFNLSKTNIKKNLFVTLYFKKKKMNLIIDLGNSKIKVAVFESDTLILKDVFGYSDWKNNIKNTLEKNINIAHVVVSNVSNVSNDDLLFINEYSKLFFISSKVKLPFYNLYETPKTLGIDRIALAGGAVLTFPKMNRLVIDAGTCITYDFIDEQDNYHGGAISPGIRLRYEALHNYTAKLPLLEKDDIDELIGSSTVKSIHSGVLNGVSGEIDSFINRYSEIHKNFIIILTGGDAVFLAKRLKNTIFANPNFLLESLNQIFQYNQHD